MDIWDNLIYAFINKHMRELILGLISDAVLVGSMQVVQKNLSMCACASLFQFCDGKDGL